MALPISAREYPAMCRLTICARRAASRAWLFLASAFLRREEAASRAASVVPGRAAGCSGGGEPGGGEPGGGEPAGGSGGVCSAPTHGCDCCCLWGLAFGRV